MIIKRIHNIFWMFTLILLMILSTSCGTKKPAIDNNTMLDGPIINDPSLANPSKYYASLYLANPTAEQLNTPIVIAVHGFSATTFEWDEWRAWADAKGKFYTSQVLLGGHGRDFEDFKNATWKDWQNPILEEYKKLSTMGFKNINFVASSTGCSLILELISSGAFGTMEAPKRIFMIDPIVLPSTKMMSVVDIFGPLIGFAEIGLSEQQMAHWYRYAPQESLKQLIIFLNLTRENLERGITLPQGTYIKVYKSIRDDSADPISALLLYKGIKTYSGNRIDVEMINSDLHVFTHVKDRANYTQEDIVRQIKAFEDIATRLTQ
jgi:carboxylesterase